MTTTTDIQKPWDFSQVLGLISTLNANHPVPIPQGSSIATGFSLNSFNSLPNDSPLSPVRDTEQGGVGLGNFSRVWEFLGAPQESPVPRVSRNTASPEHTSPTLQQRVPIKTDYTSDGAVYLTPNKNTSKSIHWRDEANGGDLIDVAPNADEAAEKLSKTQRKKKNRQERKKLGAASDNQRKKKNRQERKKLGAASDNQRTVSDFESEADDPPARKASVHQSAPAVDSSKPYSKFNLRSRDSFGKAITTWVPATPTPAPTASAKKPKSPEDFFQKRERSRSPIKSSLKDHRDVKDAPPSTPVRHHSQPIAISRTTPATVGKENRNPFVSSAASLLPASVQPPRFTAAPGAFTPTRAIPEPAHATPTKGGRHAITPKTVRTGEDRNMALFLKIAGNFYEDRGSLVKPANMTNHSTNPKGIHVFVDASNIFIGFMDQLKRARNIPSNFHIPRVEPSFDSLALLMERRRPIAKRVLVGSKPHLAAFDTAREIGYECSILDKVLKARELTARQIYFKEQEKKMYEKKKYGKTPPTRNRSGSTSGGDSGENGPVFAKEAMVEQGVDEILHLKMMESIVDTEEPSTMVLATGDAAQAEYSQGFMKMTERALQRGWKVELVSWSKNINQAYKKLEFRNKWGKQFKIVELDDYAEELLDM